MARFALCALASPQNRCLPRSTCASARGLCRAGKVAPHNITLPCYSAKIDMHSMLGSGVESGGIRRIKLDGEGVIPSSALAMAPTTVHHVL
jgi:hypothetical protein